MWFDIIKLNKNLARQWVKNFIREHLESMSSGEKITTKEMLDLLFDNKENAHYVKSGKKFKFGNVNNSVGLPTGPVISISCILYPPSIKVLLSLATKALPA